MKLCTSLISGAGNTFHILWQSNVTDKIQQKKIVQYVCKKNLADGFIFLNKRGPTYVWDFYNKDGSDAEMCGNATRCVGFFIKNKLQSTESVFILQTVAGPVQIESLDRETYKIQMTKIIPLESPTHFYCDTGVPHIVIDFSDFKNYPNYVAYCRELRFHNQYQPRGTNVTLISLTSDPKTIQAVSYERGVESFTQACGTGAMAAAFFNFKKYGQKITTVEMPGGNLLMNLENLNKPLMTGPAILLGEYAYDNEV